MALPLKKFPLLIISLSVLGLGACTEGYEAIRTDEFFPYGNQRTAGSTIAYVQAKMMPEKALKLEPQQDVKEEIKQETQDDKKVLENVRRDLEKTFREEQQKR